MDRSQAILVEDDIQLLFATCVARGEWLIGDPGGPMFEYVAEIDGHIGTSKVEPFPVALARINWAKLTRCESSHISPISDRTKTR